MYIGLLFFMFRSNTYKTVLSLFGVVCSFTFLHAQVMSTQEYINAYKYAAMQEMKVYKIPASITLGQGILESASGNSKLSRECNNHFGIKCRKNWTGTFCLADDDAPNECFRGYPSVIESYRDHSMFLAGSSRYATLFTLPVTDYKAWAEGLRTAGYATNPSYGSILIGIIQKYRLGMYDSMVLLGADYVSEDTAAQRAVAVNGLLAVYAKSGQTPADIAKEHDMGTWQIYKYNDLKRGENLDPGEIVYLKPKRRKGSVETAIVGPGQDMREISQQYGIKLKHLYKKNHLKPGQQVKAGEVLTLQKKNDKTPLLMQPGETPVKPDPVKPKPADPAPVKPQPKVNLNAEYHEVQPGETLYAIAQKYGLLVEDLIKWNKLENSTLKTGQLLVLRQNLKSSSADTTRASASKSQLDKSTKYHTVIAGETLYSIAKLYNQPVDSIMAWNNLKNSVLKPGMELKVSGLQIKANETPRTYTVQQGDTLYSISRKFGVSVADLKKWNKLVNDSIAPGNTLLLQ